MKVFNSFPLVLKCMRKCYFILVGSNADMHAISYGCTQYSRADVGPRLKVTRYKKASDLALELPVDADNVNNLFFQLQSLAYFVNVHHTVELFLQALQSANNTSSQLALSSYSLSPPPITTKANTSTTSPTTPQ